MLTRTSDRTLSAVEAVFTRPDALSPLGTPARRVLQLAQRRRCWVSAITVLALATFILPDLLAIAYRSGDDVLSLTNNLKVSLSIALFSSITVAVWILLYWRLSIEARTVTLLSDHEKKVFHEALARGSSVAAWWLFVIAVIVGQSFLISASQTDKELAWWGYPEVHWPLASVHITLALFAAAVFLWRSFRYNVATTEIWRRFGSPAKTRSRPHIYRMTTEHYVSIAAIAVLAVAFVLLSWAVQPMNSSFRSLSFDPFSAITVGVLVIYLPLIFILFAAPIILQRQQLIMTRTSRLSRWNEIVDRVLLTEHPGNEAMCRLSTAGQMTDELDDAYPSWPIPSETVRTLGAVLAVLVPVGLNLGRVLLT